jgi:hypothetical protein
MNKKTLIEQALEKAEKAEKEGNMERAKFFYNLAEKVEKVNKKAKENELNIRKERGIKWEGRKE